MKNDRGKIVVTLAFNMQHIYWPVCSPSWKGRGWGKEVEGGNRYFSILGVSQKQTKIKTQKLIHFLTE